MCHTSCLLVTLKTASHPMHTSLSEHVSKNFSLGEVGRGNRVSLLHKLAWPRALTSLELSILHQPPEQVCHGSIYFFFWNNCKISSIEARTKGIFFCICFTIQSFPCLHPQPPNYLNYFALHSTLPSPCFFMLCPLDSYQVQEYVVSCQYNNCSFVV